MSLLGRDGTPQHLLDRNRTGKSRPAKQAGRAVATLSRPGRAKEMNYRLVEGRPRRVGANPFTIQGHDAADTARVGYAPVVYGGGCRITPVTGCPPGGGLGAKAREEVIVGTVHHHHRDRRWTFIGGEVSPVDAGRAGGDGSGNVGSLLQERQG